MNRLKVVPKRTFLHPDGWVVLSEKPLMNVGTHGTRWSENSGHRFAGYWMYQFASRAEAVAAADRVIAHRRAETCMTSDLDDAHNLVHVEPS